MKEAILIIDEASNKSSIVDVVQQKLHYPVRRIDGGMFAGGRDSAANAALVIVDVASMASGLDIIRRLRAASPQQPVLVMMPYGEEHGVPDALRSGASDFLMKPLSVERLKHSMEMLLKMRQMGRYTAWLERKVTGHLDFTDIVGKHPAIVRAVEAARELASSHVPVWIEGEAGTEKELFARAIHGAGSRSGKPFVSINCQQLSPRLAEAIIFGTAHSPMEVHQFIIGKIREANGGTLFLEEVGDLPEAARQRLADFVENGSIELPDSGQVVPLDVRILCSDTLSRMPNDIAGHASQKLIRQLQAATITLPPLSQRQSDIPELVEHFIAFYSAAQMKHVRGVTPQAMEWLKAQPWQGNEQQLCNRLWRGVLVTAGEWLEVADLDTDGAANGKYPHGAYSPLGGNVLLDNEGNVKTLRSVEEEAIRFALEHSGGSMTRAAKSLGIGRSTLYRKMDGFRMAAAHISRANHTTRPMMTVSSTERS